MQQSKNVLTSLIAAGATSASDLLQALNDGALLAQLGINDQATVEAAHDMALNLAHGMVCKECGEPAPYGVGFAAHGVAASAASFGLNVCACGHSVRSTPLAPESVTYCEADTRSGVFFVDLGGLFVQCCLVARYLDRHGVPELAGYDAKVSASDNGFDWGTCGDVNEWAFAQHGGAAVLQFLLDQARAAGVEVVE